MKKILLPLGLVLMRSCFVIAQDVTPPKLINIETNGVKTYAAQGFEVQTSNDLVEKESLERPVRTLNDYTIEEIENHLYYIDLKIEHLHGTEDVEAVEEYKKNKALLIARKNELTANH